ncbi:MAG: hypothetical protein GY898_27280 [Proteobacteria bacterium]|nr:hypothetical protein [Pseudomonadota bacterium]
MTRALVAALSAVFLTAAGPVEDPAAAPKDACPSLGRCCVEGEEYCVHPAAGRGVLAVSSLAGAGAGAAVYMAAGDSLRSGEPFLQMMGLGAVGLLGSGLGAVAARLAPRGETTVLDRPGSPTLVLSLTPGGTSVLDEAAPYGLGFSFDPSFELDGYLAIRPHVAFSTSLGVSQDVDPRPQHTQPIDGQESTFPVALRAWKMKLSAGAEFRMKLPYPALVPARTYMGRIELRYRPRWELRRRVVQPGESDHQATEHHALYPATFGFRWHLSPRQRFTLWLGPRIDFISFTDHGETELHHGSGNVGSFHAEAWYSLDIPFTPEQGMKTSVTGRFNLGYVHSNLDGDGFDFTAAIGFFGPIEVSFDLRLRRMNAPVAAQISAGMIIGSGGGPFVELGLVTEPIRKQEAAQ